MTITIHWCEERQRPETRSKIWKNAGGLMTSRRNGQDAVGSILKNLQRESLGKKKVNTITVAPSVEETQP